MFHRRSSGSGVHGTAAHHRQIGGYLLGLLKADSGALHLLGGDPWLDAVELHRHLACVPGDVSLWPALTGGEVIDLLGRLRGGLDPKRRASLIERFELDPTRKSGPTPRATGRRLPWWQRWPVMRSEIRGDGRTVLLSSHILSEVEALCDQVSIIRDGAVVESGTMAELRHLARTTVSADLTTVPIGLADLAGVHDVLVQAQRITASVEPKGMAELMAALAPGGLRRASSSRP